MVEDLDNYHLKELRCSTQCHTQKTMWIIARGDESLILWWGIEYFEICLEHKFSTPFFQHLCKLKSQEREILLQFQVSYIGFTPSVVTSNNRHKGWGKLIQKLLLNQKCIGYLARAYYSISLTRYYKDDSWWSADLELKAIDDIISIGSFAEAHVLNHYVLVRKILQFGCKKSEEGGRLSIEKGDPTWHMDTGASSHLNFNVSNLSTIFDKRLFPSAHVGNGNSILVTNTGHSIIPSIHRPLHLHNVLVIPNIIKNLNSVRQFTRDNNCTIEFNAFGFSVKDFLTRHVLLRCDSSGDLYPVTKSSTIPTAFVSTSSSTWHQRLGYLGDEVLRFLTSYLQWRNAMYDEYNVLVKNGTWLLVPRPVCVNMVRSMWYIKHKFHAEGTLSRYKARLVAKDSGQQLGVDFDETFSLVVKRATIRMVLSLVVSRKWPIHQLDVKNAFLNGDLSETVYMHQPPSFVDVRFPNYGSLVAYLLLYVDDIILTASSTSLLQHLIDSLHRLFLSQRKYALQLLERAHMVNCNPSRTLVDTESKRGPDGVPVQDPTLYRRLGTLDLGLHLYASSTTFLVGYTDSDWAGCPSTLMSTSGYDVFLGDNLLSWSAKRHHTLSRSSAEDEYRGVANVVA
ncbi:ribonuclease H-like domain-containing protein [Tanacetum coccineum]